MRFLIFFYRYPPCSFFLFFLPHSFFFSFKFPHFSVFSFFVQRINDVELCFFCCLFLFVYFSLFFTFFSQYLLEQRRACHSNHHKKKKTFHFQLCKMNLIGNETNFLLVGTLLCEKHRGPLKEMRK